jgi:hypothetical protein
MAAAFTEYAALQGDFNKRVIDLMKPFEDENINDPALKGSASIKKVLPALVPEHAYDDFDIKECASSSRLWKGHNRVERLFNRLKQFRRITTRCDKTAKSFLTFLYLATAKLWLPTFVNRA